MSITTVRVDWTREVWRCASDDESRPMLQAAHIERVDAEHVRVTCSDGFCLASVVYPADVAEDFTAIDIPAELLQYMADAAQADAGCDNCGEGERVASPDMTLTLDTEEKVAEVKNGLMACRMAFIDPVGTGFPDWRELLRKVLKDQKPGQVTPSLAINPELLGKASDAVGSKYIAKMCIPASPNASVVILGSDGCSALVMPMFTPDDAAERLAKIAALAKSDGDMTTTAPVTKCPCCSACNRRFRPWRRRCAFDCCRRCYLSTRVTLTPAGWLATVRR